MEVRDIVNNYLDDSLQEGDDIRNDSSEQSAEEVAAVEVDVEDQGENQVFRRTDELQKVLFPEMSGSEVGAQYEP